MSLPASTRASAILIVDDHDLVRLGVRALLQAQASPHGPAVEVFEASSMAQALAVYERFQGSIGLVLLDLGLPDTRGLSGVSVFLQRYPQSRVVALSGAGATSLAQDAIAQSALAQGASAFLPKSANLKEVVSFIRACGLLGRDVVDGLPRTSRWVARAPRRSASGAQGALTGSQARVLQMILEGKSNKEIAQLAELREGTVKNYVSTILLLFGVQSRAELISSLR
ncbi:response regulator transcription factor [Variovorax sp. Root473]|uniref:response regulator transcription factor n=1 Tax=Variovorax sp. Root473 TaxID=1736541 RepID=UPI001F30642E|nr:response regulator transcription factor [Variovorax sp. Root473]